MNCNLDFATLRWVEKVPTNIIPINGGEKIVMNAMVQSIKTSQIQAWWNQGINGNTCQVEKKQPEVLFETILMSCRVWNGANLLTNATWTKKTGSMLKLSFWYGSSLICLFTNAMPWSAADIFSWLANKKKRWRDSKIKKKGVKQSSRTGRWLENKHNHHSLEKMNSQIQTNSLNTDYPFRLWGCSVSFVVFVGNGSNT